MEEREEREKLSLDPTRPKIKKLKTFKKTTRMWQMFVSYFLEKSPEEYPIFLRGLSKGQALNLAIGLNSCHTQHARETGMPDEAMLYSAKPRKEEGSGENESGENESWYVEISTNYTRLGLAKPSRGGEKSNWMDKFIEKGENALPVRTPAVRTPASDEALESLLDKYYREGEE